MAKKLHRFQADLTDEEWKLFQEATGNCPNKTDVFRKMVKITIAIKNGEVFLTTPKGDRIPTSIIL